MFGVSECVRACVWCGVNICGRSACEYVSVSWGEVLRGTAITTTQVLGQIGFSENSSNVIIWCLAALSRAERRREEENRHRRMTGMTSFVLPEEEAHCHCLLVAVENLKAGLSIDSLGKGIKFTNCVV